ncbi:hypothetical protein [Helicobacter sp. T3_23-1056]
MTNLTKNFAIKFVPKLSIVIPCYNEEAVITTTYNALCEKLDLLLAQNLKPKIAFCALSMMEAWIGLVRFCYLLKRANICIKFYMILFKKRNFIQKTKNAKS